MRRPSWPIALVLAACAADGPTPPPGPIPSTLIVNESQYTLLELRVHASSSYLDSPNRLESPLAVGDRILYYGDGAWYVTVFREKFQDGPILAFTIAQPMTMERGRGYRLTIFDESFRIASEPYIDPRTTSLPYIGDPGPLGPLDGGLRDAATSTISDAGTSTTADAG